MAILFISDLHIDATRPAITEQFIEFLRTEARSADALYILGDLFESWVGDDAADAVQAAAIADLKSLTAHGVPCFVMHGNRDFLLGQQFCAASGAHLLADPLIVTLYGEPVLVMHGRALHRRSRVSAPARDGPRYGLAAAISRPILGCATGAGRRRAGRQPGAHSGDGIRHH